MAGIGDYSALDRLVHRIAFAGAGVQLAAAEMEDRMFRAELEGVRAERPVFITSLPRAGTSILLLALAGLPGMASYLYRDMPFVMAPMLWQRLSGRHRKSGEKAERAHGDGIEIGYDSPEAFEEIIWRAFWPGHYQADRIRLWSEAEAESGTGAEARTFFQRHFAKIVALRLGPGATGRYLSKNNGNIARLGLIRRMFPEATILVPMRAPLAHAGSLLRQHRNFLDLHAKDAFARRYMRDIGHYEFGALHRPIAFEGFEELAGGLGPEALDYWLAYWIAAFEHIRGQGAGLHVLDYEALSADGVAGSRRLCAILDFDPALAAQIGGHFRPAPAPAAELSAHRSPLRARAEALHAEMLAELPPPAEG